MLIKFRYKHSLAFRHQFNALLCLALLCHCFVNVHCDASPSSQSSLLSFKCPEQFGYYADHSNCSKYFVCVFGEALHESCTGGLHFSSELQTCDWPRNVECAASSDSKSNANPANDDRDNIDTLYDYSGEEINPIISNQNDENLRSIDEFNNADIIASNNNKNSNNDNTNNAKDNNKNARNDDDWDLQRSRTVINNAQDRYGTVGRSISGTHQQTSSSLGDALVNEHSRTDDIIDESKNNENKSEPPKNNKVTIDDLTNPNYEEAVSSIVDESGAVHVQDGPANIFSLIASSDNLQPGGSGQDVNVYVKQLNADDLRSINTDPKRRGTLLQNKVIFLNRTQLASQTLQPRAINRFSTQRPQQQQQQQSLQPSQQLPPYFGQQFQSSIPYNTRDNAAQEHSRATQAQQRIPRQRIHIIVNNNNNYNNHSYFADELIDGELDFKRIQKPTSPQPVRHSNLRLSPEHRRPQQITVTPLYTPRTTTTTTTPLPRITSERPRVITETIYLTNSDRRSGGNSRSLNLRPQHEYTPPQEVVRPAIVVTRQPSMPQRPPAQYRTPEPYSNAVKCNDKACRLPDCYCGGTDIPGSLSVNQVPQIVLITFDDAVNDINWHIYEEIFNTGRKNPNGCPIRGTFYVSHEWTDYGQVQTLYSRGHEMASHSITHSFGERFSKAQWYKEIAGQREILHLFGGVNLEDIRGMRAPFLQGGGNKQFEMLYEANFTYDSSMPVFENSPPFWPYTLDYAISHECMIAPCPTKSFPGLWEIGMVMWQDLRGGRCSMGDACTNPSDEKGVYDMIMKNFNRHYKSNRAPFSLYYHSAWFNIEHHKRGFMRVLDEINKYKDVYFLTKWQLIQWLRQPTPLHELYQFQPWQCSNTHNRPPPCHNPTVCSVGSKSGQRFFKTCQTCPAAYPWVGNTGFAKS